MREIKFRSYTGRCFVFLDLNNDNDFTFNEFCSCLGDSPIEQYTGLKDENGREIYEGDIVTLNGEWEEIDCSIISFKEGCFRVGEGYENEAGSYLSSWRVIGNIHENQDLLDDTIVTNKEEK